MSKYTKRTNKRIIQKRGGTRKRNDPTKDRFMGCSAEYALTTADKSRADELAKLTNQELRDLISELIGGPKGKQTFSAATTKSALIRLLICMEHQRDDATAPSELFHTLSEFKPTQIDKSASIGNILPSILSSGQPCGDGQKCPVGLRCNKTSKVCEELKQITVFHRGNSAVLSVDGTRGKQYDLLFLGSQLNRILELKGTRNGKKITGKILDEEITWLKDQLKPLGRRVDQTYYGTLNDEKIIQIIYLEQMLREAAPDIPTEPETAPDIPTEPETAPDIPTEEVDDNVPISSDDVDATSDPIPVVLDRSPAPVQEPIPDLTVDMSDREHELQEQIGIMPDNIETTEYNDFLFRRELADHQDAAENDKYDFLYPDLNDSDFNTKIALRKEFNDTQYDGKIYNIETHAEKMCSLDFELMPHQLFVKNFMSFQTPYNALLLYHGLGTGKTCSAIGIAEEMRTYMKQVGHKHRIIVVASPNVQNNFKLQLFDERKLEKDGDLWNLNTCIGNTLLAEVIPTQTASLPKEKIVSMITSLINQYYVFMGYGEFANFIKRKTMVNDIELGITAQEQKEMEIGKIRKIFNNRLIIVDEVHNIRLMQENKQSKKTASLLMHVCKYAKDMRLLLLSATPMFNSYKEIIWLCNLLNMVDKRSTIKEEDVFDKDGNFLPASDSKEGGRELLQRKLTGYVSHIRGENPYSFPYRIYPDVFSPDNIITPDSYPSLQMNKKPIDSSIKRVPVYMNTNGSYQKQVYKYIIEHMMQKSFNTTNIYGAERDMPTFENMETFGYTHLKEPLEALNIVFPYNKFVEEVVVDQEEEEEPEVEKEEPEEQEEEEEEEETDEEEEESVESEPEIEESVESEPEIEESVESEPEPEVEESVESEPEPEVEEPEKSNAIAQTGGEDPISPTNSDESIVPPTDDASEIIRNMVGKQGLMNVVSYKTIRNPYELRYDFEYKRDVLSQYGRIFSAEHLSKYSGKIANICNIIRKSKGIVMIYSQYIDGGVVPIALALEEMGFTRYGSASYTKSLFKTPPTGPIDATTMKPLSEMEDKQLFRPAKYVMITGDKTLSPNNLADLKYITNPNNLHGENVRVVLITRAAAEGLDFKNIRQLHVLEPWYNMNRIEQIIGRTVRNLSHCALPFPERNVEIYLHATSPSDDDNLETADLYVYRFAEKKAIQIGQVSRLLKETAVDCILNIGQTNFTVDKLLESAANQHIKLSLASGIEVDYQIGDRPGTDICDYMDNCSFVCSPTLDITADTELTKTTYNEEYAKMNFTSIIKHIRALFKEQTFYPRDILLRAIQINREYPIEHIDYALSYFIENTNEHLVDKYGRLGYLINKDDIYAFQPIEITDENASIYDRSAPITYKPPAITLDLPLDKNEYQAPDSKITISKKLDSITEKYTTDYTLTDIRSDYFQIVSNLESKLSDIERFRDSKTAINHGETDWYKHLGKVFEQLTKYHEIPENAIRRFAVFHYIDGLSIEDRLHLVYYLYHKTIVIQPTSSNVEPDMKLYFNEKIIRSVDQTGIVLAANNRIDLYIQNADSQQWQQAEATEIRNFHGDLQKRFSIPEKIILDTPTPPRVIGFMHIFKQNEMVFKIKDITSHRNNRGSKCNSMGKIDIIKRLNRILEENPYPSSSKMVPYTIADAETILRPGLCVMVEIITRYFNEHVGSQSKRVWFFDVEKTLANKIIELKSA